mmetsp:Transcript_30254/g.99656  ORF Transcript_30254/g.99656 Transcript_30254/m.99656 type:complete len:236 (+) Transcript_30254:452-1159(+)
MRRLGERRLAGVVYERGQREHRPREQRDGLGRRAADLLLARPERLAGREAQRDICGRHWLMRTAGQLLLERPLRHEGRLPLANEGSAAVGAELVGAAADSGGQHKLVARDDEHEADDGELANGERHHERDSLGVGGQAEASRHHQRRRGDSAQREDLQPRPGRLHRRERGDAHLDKDGHEDLEDVAAGHPLQADLKVGAQVRESLLAAVAARAARRGRPDHGRARGPAGPGVDAL